MYSPNKQTAIAILALIFFAVPTISFGQASVPQNSPQQSTDFLGWEQSVQFPLNINHKGEFPIIFSTANSEHMRLTYKGQLLMGIVATTSNAKLDIKAGSDKIGLRAHATGSNVNNYGGWFTANSGTGANYAVYGEAISFSSGSNYGVAGRACNAANNYAVYGVTCDTTGQNWAGYFDGKAYCSSGVWSGSDENLKTDIQDLEGATGMLMALEPKSYVFDPDIVQLNLPEGLQYGLLAQNLEEVIPTAVTDITTPAPTDEEGNPTAEPLTFKGVNYQQLIPVLIAGFKEQSADLAANEAKIADLLERLEHSEANLGGSQTGQTDSGLDNSRLTLQQNAPNPFEGYTVITCRLDREAHVRVDVRNQSGELVAVLADGRAESGTHQFQWDATDIPPGMYVCTLRTNGKTVARKMIKL